MTTFELGCAVCYEGWAAGNPPSLVGHSEVTPVGIYRCAICGTYWLESHLYATPIRADDISLHAPDIALRLANSAQSLAVTG